MEDSNKGRCWLTYSWRTPYPLRAFDQFTGKKKKIPFIVPIAVTATGYIQLRLEGRVVYNQFQPKHTSHLRQDVISL